MSRSLRFACLPTMLAAVFALPAQANLDFDFNDGPQGVVVTAGGTLTHEVEAGNGYLAIADIDNADMFLVLPVGAAPVDWTGYIGGTLAFDARSLNGLPPTWPSFGLLTFTSANGVAASFDFVPADQPGNTWARYTVSLDEATFGPSLASVLGSLQSVTVNLESGNGPIERVGIDNLTVSAVPEPQSVALMLAGLGVLGAVARRRQRR